MFVPLHVLLIVLPLAATFPLQGGLLRNRAAIPPAADPFYTAPRNLTSYRNGQIIRSRAIQPAYYSVRPLNVTAYQLLYKTTSANTTTPLATVTTVFQPSTHRANQLLTFQTAEDSAASQCAPSYNYQQGSNANSAIVQAEEVFLIAFLDQGYTISAPDYEGPNSAFGAGRLAGHGVLDGLRAALAFAPLRLSNTSQVGGYGYSGGAIATGWAAALQPTYASELNVVGWAHGGTPANLTGTLQYIDGGLFAGFAVGGVAGLTNAYQSILEFVNRVATSAGHAALDYAETHCAQDDITMFAFKDFETTTYQTKGSRLVYDPIVQAVTISNTLGLNASETPTAPLYVYHASADEIIPLMNATTMVNNYCAHGIKSLLYEIDMGPAEHASAEILFFPNAVNFINARFAGIPSTSGCVATQTVLPIIDPGAAPTGLQVIYSDLLSILTGSIGLDDGILKSNLIKLAAAQGNTAATANIPP